jgi:hypothetical protein
MSKKPFNLDDAQKGIKGTPAKITKADERRFVKMLQSPSPFTSQPTAAATLPVRAFVPDPDPAPDVPQA